MTYFSWQMPSLTWPFRCPHIISLIDFFILMMILFMIFLTFFTLCMIVPMVYLCLIYLVEYTDNAIKTLSFLCWEY